MFKNKLSVLLCALLCALALAACGQTTQPQADQQEALLPDDLLSQPVTLYFSSGAGAWATELNLGTDGTFEGNYHDSEMGSFAPEYPNGTVYYCNFSGQFIDAQPRQDGGYDLTLDRLDMEDEEDSEVIRDKILYIASLPHGLDSGSPEGDRLAREFVLYLPGTPVADLDEDFLSWWPEQYDPDGVPDKFNCFALWNTVTNYGFFSYPEV